MRSFQALLALAALAAGLHAAPPARSQPLTSQTPAQSSSPAAAATPAEPEDPFLWLEEVDGPRALAWVNAQNTRTLAELEADPRYAGLHERALGIVNATDRIAYPNLMGHSVMNFWQDPTHVRGIWRRTTRAGYEQANPAWETVLDLDALAAAEHANWVWEGADCRAPDFRRCLIALSNGGEDATVVREFDMDHNRFVEGGFSLPSGKQDTTWLDDDHLLVGRDWGPDTMTTSGYPFVIRRLARGQALDQAQEVFRGQASDVAVNAAHMIDGDGRTLTLIIRAVTFFESEFYALTPAGVVRMPLPPKASIQGVANGSVFVTLQQDWTWRGRTYRSGALLALRGVMDGPGSDPAQPRVQLVFAPGPRQSIEQVTFTAHHAVAAIYDNVRGSIVTFTDRGGRWRAHTVLPPSPLSVSITTASDVDEAYFYNVDGYLNAARLWRADAGTGAPGAMVRALPDRFDASEMVVEQFEATSTDGVRIPYFVTHRRNMPLDGSNPTVLYAYGGFQSSELPGYSASVGRLWLENGGVWVVANIRGGGEFGPVWHQAGLRTRRQIIYDDFAAVGRDLIARGITSPRRLGIEGGSNGGLLMGVEFNQHPEMWRAVVIQVPLLDMLRYTQIGAGASWIDEYGDPANPVERAFLRTISPYHNLRAGAPYPEPFFVTSTRDDRVTPVHARKMAARMEAMGLPFLYYENTDGGHAAAANLQARARRVALEFTYLSRRLMD